MGKRKEGLPFKGVYIAPVVLCIRKVSTFCNMALFRAAIIITIKHITHGVLSDWRVLRMEAGSG